MKRSVNIWNHLDKVTVLLFLVMVIMGWFNIYAAVYNEEHKEILDLSQRYGKQFIWIIATIILSIFILIIDSRFYLFFAWAIYAIVILMLILVLVLGTEINGARSWFEFGPLYLQPSEFAKFATALALAGFLSRRNIDLLCLTGFGIMVLTGGVIFILDRFLLKSLGNDLVIITTVILSGMVYSYYIYMKKAMGILIIYLFLLGGIIYINSVDYGFNHILKPHQKERVEIMLGFKSDPHGTGYNVNQSIISIGSGGFTGKGYLQGTQTKFKFVPSQSTDFIFCTVGEEWGFLGSATVIGIYLFFLIRLLASLFHFSVMGEAPYGVLLSCFLFFSGLMQAGPNTWSDQNGIVIL
ncbi:MAG: mrdB [Bacteroidetes bacterium]|nr:mrdB [Bacteroidota bacterium]